MVKFFLACSYNCTLFHCIAASGEQQSHTES